MNLEMKITAKRVSRARWSSEKAFVLATAAAAVGLGNVWRFPYLAGENGGAAFIIAYIVAVLLLGIPLMLLEISSGTIENGGAVRTFRAINRRLAFLGWGVVALTLIIMSYYLVITGWTLGYAVDSLSGNIRSFDVFTGSLEPLLYFFIVVLITGMVVARGVKMIELLSKIMMPLFLLVILVLTGYSLTLDGASQAMSFLFNPDFSSFASPALWVLAFGQAFYSLAVGQGYLITYGSFLPKKVNLPRATGSVALIETGIALVAGLMIFPIVFTYGLDPAEGSDLAFNTLPLAFENIAIGDVLAIGFFWLFFLAAISSCIAGMEVVKTAMREELRLTHGWATLAAFAPVVPLGLLAALSFSSAELVMFGRPFLEVLDLFAANQVVVALGIIGGAAIAWNIPKHQLLNKFSNKHRRLASHMIRWIKYAWVLVLTILLVSFLV